MSSNMTASTYYNPLPDPQTTNPVQFCLLQELGQNDQSRVSVPHPLAHRYAQHRHQQRALAQAAVQQNATLHQPGNLHRGGLRQFVHGGGRRRRKSKLERRVRAQAQENQDNLDSYGVSDPKKLILEANSSNLLAILRIITPVQLRAMLGVAIALERANENVPPRVPILFNYLMGRDLTMPLDAPIR